MKIAVPSYFYPSTEWDRMLKARPGIVVINPNSGPGEEANPEYRAVVRKCVNQDVNCLAYIATAWGTKASGEIKDEIYRYRSWYPGLKGFFLDEAATHPAFIPHYRSIMPKGALNVLNPGTWPDEGYAKLPCVLMTCEQEFNKYAVNFPPDWTAKYPAKKFWHCVFNAPALVDALTVVNMAKARNCGYVFVTDDSGANPYDQLPGYWEQLRGAAK